MTEPEIRKLWDKYLSEELSEEEFGQLWASLREHEAMWAEFTGEVWKDASFHGLSEEEGRKKALAAILHGGRKPVVRVYRWWVAAAVVIAIVSGLWLLYRRPVHEAVARVDQPMRDVEPGMNAAVLTLGDGSKRVLDSGAIGGLGKQGDADVVNQDGKLSYHERNGKASVVYNTLTTQRGNRYQLVLPDGSRVWLNAASSIRYPTVFADEKRKVSITGEAYFEVAKDVDRPFEVSANGMNVEVLGTSFNINAYSDERVTRATLLNGIVRVDRSVLKPGEEAAMDGNGAMMVYENKDVEKTVAWKDNLFIFSKDELSVVMRQLSRWYNVEVKYEGDLKGLHFSGIISRNNNLSQILKLLLASTDKVKFEVQGGVVTVSSTQ